ncbi:MAG: hypothetical protein LH472_13860 [Pyrinomonadaceae bacterium]|nr:hypothetical protein [Pyrinomonadaceae bacterium]
MPRRGNLIEAQKGEGFYAFAFYTDLPLYCGTFRKEKSELTFIDFRNMVIEWLKDNRPYA